MIKRATPCASSLLRHKLHAIAWLLLFLCKKTTLWIRFWLKIWVQKPLMRLGIGVQDDDDDENGKDAVIDDAVPLYDAARYQNYQEGIALPYGLVNNGNLCFVNAVLQCLLTVPSFLESVDRALRMRTQLHLVHDQDVEAQEQRLLVAKTLVSLLKGMFQEKKMDLELEAEAIQDRQRYFRDDNQQKMRTFRSALSQCTYLVSNAASRQEQQDAEEFLLFLLELLHDVLRSPAHPDRQEEELEHFLQTESLLLRKLKGCDPNNPRSYLQPVAHLGEVRWNHFLRQNASVVTDLFSAQTVRGFQCCVCANLTCLHEEQRIISLTIASEKGGQTLAECLEHYRHPEQLTGENRVYCDVYCRAKTACLTQTLLQHVPPVLILQLQRFRHTSSVRGQTEKVDTPVSFPCGRDDLLNITMNTFGRDDEKRVTFELTAVCVHLGSSIDSGHYVAYVRHHNPHGDAASSDHWLRIDDEVVSVIDEAMLRRETLCTAYLLFYAHVRK